MTGWARWSPISGMVFVALWISVFVVVGDDIGDTNQEVLDWYADSGNRDKQHLAFWLVAAASLALIWFASTLRHRLRERDQSMLPSLALGGGVAAATLWVAAFSAWTAIANAVEEEDEFVVVPDTARAFDAFGYILFVGAGMASSLLVLGASVVALRTGLLPKWLAWLGVPIAAIMLVTFIFIPFFVLLGWVLVVSLVLMFWKPAAEAPAAAG
ncbi:MAG: hypothetical protein ACRDO9_06850 [Gaiellales bacterium]